MVAKTDGWKLGRIAHEFDGSLDRDPELRSYAEMAADLLDSEAGDTYPTSIRWSACQPARSGAHGKRPAIHVEVRDTTLGIGVDQEFTLEELQASDPRLKILRLWTDFLRLRQHELIDRVFPPIDRLEAKA